MLGGVVGYARAGSKPSLAGGLASSALYLASAQLIGANRELPGHSLASATSATLASSMGARAARTKKFMPAGVISGTTSFASPHPAIMVISKARMTHHCTWPLAGIAALALVYHGKNLYDLRRSSADDG